MAERIDHAANARRNIDGLHDYQAEEGMTDESMLTVAIEAQVHATLALVEQQRIANLIALASVSEPRLRVVLLDDAMDSLTIDRTAGL